MKVRLPRKVRAVLRGGTMPLVATVLMAAIAAAAEPRSVLLIYADVHLAAPAAALDRSLRDTIGTGAPVPIRFDTEYLDGAWVQHGADIRQAIRTRYAGRTFDLVIPCGESALRFALDERDALFPSVPMVFFGVEEGALCLRMQAQDQVERGRPVPEHRDARHPLRNPDVTQRALLDAEEHHRHVGEEGVALVEREP